MSQNSSLSFPPTTSVPSRSLPDGLEAANRAFEKARQGNQEASWSTARNLYEAFLKSAGPNANPVDRAEACFFSARCKQQENDTDGARRDFREMLENQSFTNSPFQSEAAFRLAEISYRAGDYENAQKELLQCQEILKKLPEGTQQPDYASWITPLLADCSARTGNHVRATQLFSEILDSGPSSEIRSFIGQSVSRACLDVFRRTDPGNPDDLSQLPTEITSSLEILQRHFSEQHILGDTLRGLAGIAYDKANVTPNEAAWRRAKDLFVQTQNCGTPCPHQADCDFFLGWCEFRLGNFSQAHSLFERFLKHPSVDSDSRSNEARSLKNISLAEERLLTAQEASGEGADATRKSCCLEALNLLSEEQDAGRAEYVGSMALRAARLLVPSLDPVSQPQEFQNVVGSTRSLLGARYQSSGLDVLLFNRGRALLYPTEAVQPGDRDRGLAILRVVSADFPSERTGLLAGIEVARVNGDHALLLKHSESLLASLTPLTDANRELWMYAITQKLAGQLNQGDLRGAEETFSSAEEELSDSPLIALDQLRSSAFVSFLQVGERILGQPDPSDDQLRLAREIFETVSSNELTQGSSLRARARLGQAEILERQGNVADALVGYQQIQLLYPESENGRPAFVGRSFDRVREQANAGIRRLSN